MVEKDGAAVVEGIIRGLGQRSGRRQIFVRYLLPRFKTIMASVNLPPIKDASGIQMQIARLASLAADGSLDLDSMTAISRVLPLALNARLEEIEDLVAEREARNDDG